MRIGPSSRFCLNNPTARPQQGLGKASVVEVDEVMREGMQVSETEHPSNEHHDVGDGDPEATQADHDRDDDSDEDADALDRLDDVGRGAAGERLLVDLLDTFDLPVSSRRTSSPSRLVQPILRPKTSTK